MHELVSEKACRLLVLEYFIGAVLDVAEVHQPFFCLHFVINPAESFYQLCKIFYIRTCGFDLKPEVFSGVVEAVLFCGGNRLLKDVPVFFHILLDG